MTEWEKAQKGYLYDANYDKEIVEARTCCADLCYEFNNLRPSDTEKQQELLKKILGKMEGTPVITAPFYCDYGINISVYRDRSAEENLKLFHEMRDGIDYHAIGQEIGDFEIQHDSDFIQQIISEEIESGASRAYMDGLTFTHFRLFEAWKRKKYWKLYVKK